jgi:hypothetical protein
VRPPRDPRNTYQTIEELHEELGTLIKAGHGKEHLNLQIGVHEHEELKLMQIRVFRFERTITFYLVF